MRPLPQTLLIFWGMFFVTALYAEESPSRDRLEIDFLWDTGGTEAESPNEEDEFDATLSAEVRPLPESGSIEPELLLSPARQRVGVFLFLALTLPYLAYRTFLGSRRGWLREIFGLAPIVLFFVLIFYGNATHYLLLSLSEEKAQDAGWFFHTLAALALLGALILIFFVSGRILTFILGKSPDGGLKTSWRIGGAFCGAIIASTVILICLTALYTLSTFAWFFLEEDDQDPNFLTRFLLSSRQTIDQSFLGPIVQKTNPIKEEQYRALWDLRENLRWDQLTAKIHNRDDEKATKGKNALQALADDEDIHRKFEQGEYLSLLFDPRIRRVLNDPQSRATLRSGVQSLTEQKSETKDPSAVEEE